jgi:hypothetical protein
MSRLTRFLFIGLMIVLLPMRSWAGDVMATELAVNVDASRAATAGEQTKVLRAHVQASMPADCIMQSQPSPDAATHCSSCDTCELCLAVLNPTPIASFASQGVRHISPLATNASFTSAASASNLKPPIS